MVVDPAKLFCASRMDKSGMRAQFYRWAICLAPSVVILGVIGLGAGLRVSWFELSWSNDLVFVLVAIAALLPVTKLPLLFLDFKQTKLMLATFPDLPLNPRERAAQIQYLQPRLERLRDMPGNVGSRTRQSIPSLHREILEIESNQSEV